MIRGLSAGIRRSVTAKLRERGISEDVVGQLTESQLSEAVKFFSEQLRAHQARGRSIELAIDDAFADLSQWTAQLAETQRSAVSTPDATVAQIEA